MLSTVEPVTSVKVAIRPVELAIALLDVIDIGSHEHAAIGPHLHSLAVAHVVVPLALEFNTVGPFVNSFPGDAIVYELAHV